MRKTFRFICEKLELPFMFLFFTLMSVSVTLQILTRWLSISFSWTEEVARYSFVWFVFFGTSFCVKNKNNIRFELLDGIIKGRFAYVLDIIRDFIVMVIYAFIFVLSVRYIPMGHKSIAPALGVPMTIINIAAPIGTGLTAIRAAFCLYEDVRNMSVNKAAPNGGSK